MDFTLSKQQQMVKKMYREFAENEVKPLAKKVDAEEYFPKETVEKMGKLGICLLYTSCGRSGHQRTSRHHQARRHDQRGCLHQDGRRFRHRWHRHCYEAGCLSLIHI